MGLWMCSKGRDISETRNLWGELAGGGQELSLAHVEWENLLERHGEMESRQGVMDLKGSG